MRLRGFTPRQRVGRCAVCNTKRKTGYKPFKRVWWPNPDAVIEAVADQMLDLLTPSLAMRPENLAHFPSIPGYPMQVTPSGFFSHSAVALARGQKPLTPKGDRA